MKKLLCFIVIFLLCVSFSYADRNTATTKGFTTSQLIKRGDVKVYCIDFIATSNNGNFAIHNINANINAITGDSSTTIKAEGQEASSGNGKHYDFSQKPLEFSNGLYLYVNNGTVVITYE